MAQYFSAKGKYAYYLRHGEVLRLRVETVTKTSVTLRGSDDKAYRGDRRRVYKYALLVQDEPPTPGKLWSQLVYSSKVQAEVGWIFLTNEIVRARKFLADHGITIISELNANKRPTR